MLKEKLITEFGGGYKRIRIDTYFNFDIWFNIFIKNVIHVTRKKIFSLLPRTSTMFLTKINRKINTPNIYYSLVIYFKQFSGHTTVYSSRTFFKTHKFLSYFITKENNNSIYWITTLEFNSYPNDSF